jgi:outer membrane protein insertion porin family
MSLVRHPLLALTAILIAGWVGCAPFDHSPQRLARSIAYDESGTPAKRHVVARESIAQGRSTGAPVVRGQSPDGPTSEDFTRGPMLPAGSARVAQQPLYGAQPGSSAPLYPPGGVPQTTMQPPPANAYGAPNYTFQPGAAPPAGQPLPGFPANNQPYPLPYDGSTIPGFPDAAGPSILGDRPPPPPNLTPLDIYVQETRTGRFMFGVGVNSDAGVTGQITVDERNFDLFNPPTSWDDFLNGTAFRGAGQGLRLEAQPGNQVQRYLVSFTEPYLFDGPLTFNASAFYFQRNYFDYSEERVGGRLALGYRLTPDLSLTTALRAEDVKIGDPRVENVPQLQEVLGSTDFYSGRVTLAHDTRDNSFLATEGHYLELAFEQGFGEFSFPRAEIDYRQFFTMRERADGTGKHILALSTRLGFSGDDTPLFERYFAGGYSSLRGFSFRGASPMQNTVRVGGDFKFLGSAEYFFPITADDMVKGTVFVDYGTVEETVKISEFRVAPGFGFLFNIPALGPAPLAVNFAFPIAQADTDDEQIFSFFFGASR